jgi:hypothetical protein
MKHILLILSFVGVANLGLMAQVANTPPVQNSSETDNRKVNDISISVYNSKLYVFRARENSCVEIRNMLGEKIFEARISNSEKEEFYLNLKKGFYIVKIGNLLQRILIK